LKCLRLPIERSYSNTRTPKDRSADPSSGIEITVTS
jgi:hypothetical protein